MVKSLLLALALLPGLAAPAVAQSAAPAASPPSPDTVKAIAEVTSADAAV